MINNVFSSDRLDFFFPKQAYFPGLGHKFNFLGLLTARALACISHCCSLSVILPGELGACSVPEVILVTERHQGEQEVPVPTASAQRPGAPHPRLAAHLLHTWASTLTPRPPLQMQPRSQMQHGQGRDSLDPQLRSTPQTLPGPKPNPPFLSGCASAPAPPSLSNLAGSALARSPRSLCPAPQHNREAPHLLKEHT